MTRQASVRAGLIAAALAASTAAAQPPPDTRGRGIELRVGTVLASSRGTYMDQRLVSLRRQFDSFFSYSSYRLVEQHQRRLRWGRRAQFDIPGGRYLVITPREFRDGHVILRVSMSDGHRRKVQTLVRLRDRGTLLLGGERQKDGVVILAIGAERIE